MQGCMILPLTQPLTTRLDENRMRPEGTHTRSKGRYYLSCELKRTVNRPAGGQFLPSLTCVPLWASTLLLKKTTLDQGWRGEGSPAAVTGHPETVYGSPRGPAVSQRTEKHAVRCLYEKVRIFAHLPPGLAQLPLATREHCMLASSAALRQTSECSALGSGNAGRRRTVCR